MPIRLRRRRLAGGKNTLQVPLAERAAGRYRIDDASKGYAFCVGTRSHIDLLTTAGNDPESLPPGIGGSEVDANTKLKFTRASFPLAQIDFSSGPSSSIQPTFIHLREECRGECCTIPRQSQLIDEG